MATLSETVRAEGPEITESQSRKVLLRELRKGTGERRTEDYKLTPGYFVLMLDRYPFAKLEECHSEASAFAWGLEKMAYEVPTELIFDELTKETIPVQELRRIHKAWKNFETKRRKWEYTVEGLHEKWKTAPEIEKDPATDRILEEFPLEIRGNLKKALRAMLHPNRERSKPLKSWKTEEHWGREALYKDDKNVLTALRVYLTLLIEQPYEGSKKSPIIPRDHPLYKTIIYRIKVIETIEVFHQIINFIRAHHHAQETGRMRKSENLPYVWHEYEVTLNGILDVLPYLLDPQKSIEELENCNPALMVIILMLHDAVEDAPYALKEILKDFLETRGNFYDSTIENGIVSIDPSPEDLKSQDPRGRQRLKSTYLDIIKEKDFEMLRRMFLALSNDAELMDLSIREMERIVRQNIAGRQRTLEIMKFEDSLDPRVRRIQDRINSNINPQREPFKTFRKSHGKKCDAALMRAHALLDSKEHNLFALCKAEDRAHNHSHPIGNPEKDLRNLRETRTRLIAWMCANLEEHPEHPLYNALPRIIDATLNGYERFGQENPGEITQEDREYIDGLKNLQGSVERWKIPETGLGAIVYEYQQAVREKIRKKGLGQLPLFPEMQDAAA